MSSPTIPTKQSRGKANKPKRLVLLARQTASS